VPHGRRADSGFKIHARHQDVVIIKKA